MFVRSTLLFTASLVSGFSNSNSLFSRPIIIRSSSFYASSSPDATMEPKESKLNGPPLPALSSIGKRLFLVRHGEVINPGGERSVYYGAMDVPLSSLGELEAQVAGEYLSQFKLSKVFSSPLSRAIYGAGEVLKRQSHHDCLANQEVIILDGFKELDRGDWCGKTKEEIGADLMARFDACDETVTPNNGESYLTLKQRVTKALETTLAQMDQGSAACIVSHLQVTRCLLSDALGIPTGEMVNLKVATASVTCIDYENGVPTVMYQSYKPDAELVASTDGAN